MSASADPRAQGAAFPPEGSLTRLESRHRQLQLEHDLARRRLGQAVPKGAEESRAAWRDYCEVIADLEDATAALEHLRIAAG
jgi:hypothetical protein